jgi:NTE family protein
MRSGARWLTLVSLGWALARWRRMRPRSLLDNAPLEKLLVKMVPLVRLPRLIRKGHLRRWRSRRPATARASTSPSLNRPRP